MAERRAAAVRSTLLRATQLASLADLGPVLLPLGSAACRLAVLGLQNFPSGGPKRAPRAELEACSDRTKTKSKEKRRGLTRAVNNYVARHHYTTLAILLLLGRFLGGAANGTKPPTARQSRPARQIQQ